MTNQAFVRDVNDLIFGMNQQRIFAGRISVNDFAHQFLARCVACTDNPIETVEPGWTADFAAAFLHGECAKDFFGPGLRGFAESRQNGVGVFIQGV